MKTVITKRKAHMMVIKPLLANLIEAAGQYSQVAESITINGNQAIVVFSHIESDPIWLLDLRRSGVPYLWFWGDDFRDYRYATALKQGKVGTFHTDMDERSRSKPDQDRFLELKSDFRNHVFHPDRVADVMDVVASLQRKSASYALA